MTVLSIKKRILPISIALIALMAFPGMAASGSSSSEGEAILYLEKVDPFKKRMPSPNYLEIVYSQGFLTLTSNCYEGHFSLSFTNLDTGESHEVPSIIVGESASISLSNGEYEVAATGPDGLALVGFMQVY